MIFLVHVKFGHYDLYFKFEYLDNALALVERIKLTKVEELSDDLEIRTTIEALTEEEFNEKIKKVEEY